MWTNKIYVRGRMKPVSTPFRHMKLFEVDAPKHKLQSARTKGRREGCKIRYLRRWIEFECCADIAGTKTLGARVVRLDARVQ